MYSMRGRQTRDSTCIESEASVVYKRIFLLSANVSAHSEQVYEMTDHQIKNNTINKAYEHKDPTNNGEQRDGKVFALIN
ncbi:hypothetical protein GQX38_02265 [Staphylococcus aureus]|nr:hypothetical protein [Staphylococcus aureus]